MTGDKAQARTIRDNELVSANNPFPEIPVTVPQIIRQAGHRTYQRGVAYQRNREVIRYSYDEDERTLTGLVNGSTIIPYEVTIRFFPAVSGSATFTARCTCPVLTDCKHAVALMLTALDRASVAKKALSEHPGPVGVPGAAAKDAAEARGSADSKSADVAEAKKAADPLAALRASGALTTAAKLPAPDAAATEPENTQGSFALNELGASPSLQAEASATKISAWRRDLSSVLSARQDLAGIDSMRVSGALDFSLSVSGSYARGRNMPGATPSINLLARPLMASKTGRWIKGGLSWETFASSVGGPVGRHEIYPEHERFFAELYSIARPWQNMYSSHRDWISISASASTLLWDVLARAEDIGLPLLVNGREVNYAVLSPAQVRLHAAASEEKHAEGTGLQLQAALSWEGREGELLRQLWLPAAHCHPIGTPRTGFFALGGLAQQEYEQAAKAVHWKTARPGALDEVGRESFVQKTAQKDAQEAPTEEVENSAPTIAPAQNNPAQNNPAQGERMRYSPAVPELPEGVELALIPLVEPLDAASESLISAGTVHIPAAERATFQKEYLPALSRSIPSLTPDPALALPRVKPPHLVLEISFDEQVRHDAQLSWRWEYPLNPFAEDSAEEASTQNPAAGSDVYSLPVFGYPGEEGGEIRDERFEARVLRSVRAILAAHPALSRLEERRIEGWETRELLSAILPKLRRVSAVQVRFNGTPPEFVEATDALIEITVSEGNSRDWFGLGIAVKVNNWTVPFAQIFEALDRGADRILLGNGTYFSLRRPEFKTLRTLIAEARELDDAGGELRINRHQAGLFSELESLAASVHTTARWDAQVRSLLELVEGLEDADKSTEKAPDKSAQGFPAPQKASRRVIAQRPVPTGLQATLRPYQVEGFQWLSFLYEQRLGGILADDMGLGKTVQALALLAHAIEEHRAVSERAASERAAERGESFEPFTPFLVVAPTSVITNWAAEAERFLPEAKVVTITETTAGKTPLSERIAGAHLVLTSYTLLRMDEDAYTGYARTLGRAVDKHTADEHAGDSTGEHSAPEGWGALLLDEAQFVKNTGTRAWSIARAMPARTKIAMTGTPIENNLMELWALLAIVADGLFPSARAFRDLYARPAESGEDPAHAAATAARLRRRIRPLMLRRTKELVAAELPAKNDTRVNLPLAPGHRRIYDTHLQRERQKVLGLLEDMDKNRFTIFQSLTLLRRLALDAALIDPDAYAGVSSVKRDYLVQQLPGLLERGHRVLVFSQFTGYLKSISARLAEEGIGHLYLDGSTRNRAEVIEAFTSGQEPVFLISLKAGGFGLNLTEADHVFIMDPWWNPAAEQQAVDRIHRIGQDKEVHVYRLVAEGTIEEKVMQLKESKAALFDAVVGEGEFASAAVTAEDVRELFAPAVER